MKATAEEQDNLYHTLQRHWQIRRAGNIDAGYSKEDLQIIFGAMEEYAQQKGGVDWETIEFDWTRFNGKTDKDNYEIFQWFKSRLSHISQGKEEGWIEITEDTNLLCGKERIFMNEHGDKIFGSLEEVEGKFWIYESDYEGDGDKPTWSLFDFKYYSNLPSPPSK